MSNRRGRGSNRDQPQGVGGSQNRPRPSPQGGRPTHGNQGGNRRGDSRAAGQPSGSAATTQHSGGPAQSAASPSAASLALEPRLSANELDSLVNVFRNLQVDPSSMPLRPGWGTAGTPLTLLSNFFALRLPKDFTVYDYDVKISPDDLRGPGKARIFELLARSAECAPYMGYIAHDRSKRLVSSVKLPQPLRINVPFSEAGVPPSGQSLPIYTVEIEFQRAMDTAEITP